jgi:hypothetical protein
MKKFRVLSALLVFFYAVAFLGAALHTHSKRADDFHCKLCQISTTALILTAAVHCSPQTAVFHESPQRPDQLTLCSLAADPTGRAPPLS